MIKRFFVFATLLFPVVSSAANDSIVDYSEPILILTFYSVVSAVALGIITSIVIIVNGRRMRGGVFGGALIYLGIGMLIVLTGTIASFSPSSLPSSMQGVLPSILNTIGYVTMAFAANKILSVTKGN